MKIYLYIKKLLSFVIAITFVQSVAYSQKGYPYISHYTFNEAIDNENYDIIQDNNHNILIANRKGILTFDSRKWDLLPLPYFPVVLAKSPVDGTVFAGCRNGFGMLVQDDKGKYNYILLSDTLFTGEISKIEFTSGNDFFISGNKIFFTDINSEAINLWEFPFENEINGSFVFQDEFYFMINNKGLYKAEEDTFKLILNDHVTANSKLIFAIKSDEKDILLAADNNKMYIFNGSSVTELVINDAEYLNASIITDGVFLGDTKVAIGSLMGGVLIFDYKTGITSSILNYKTGLPDDEIYCLGADSNRGIWLCHALGVSRIDNFLNVKNLTWYPGLSGNITNVAHFNNMLYVGTSDGLYALEEKREYSEKLVYTKKKTAPSAQKQVPIEKTQISTPEKATSASDISKKSESENLSKKEQRKKRRETKTEAVSQTQSTQQTSILDKIINTVENPTKIFQKKPEDEHFLLSKRKVYSLQAISHSYSKISGVTGKSTEIIAIKDHLLVSTNNGLYDIRDKKAFPVLPETYINFISTGLNEKYLFAGSENSLFVFELVANRWELVRELNAMDYPVYSALMISPGELWLGSDNSVHKLSLDKNFYEESDETFPITTQFPDKVTIKSINNEPYFFLSSGIFKINNNEIESITTFNDLSSLPGYYFSDKNIVWYRSSGHWESMADSAKRKNLPEHYLNVFRSVQDIYPDKNGNLYVVANGKEVFQIRNDSEGLSAEGFSLLFSGLKGKNSEFYTLNKPKISYKNSSLHIDLSAPYYIAPAKTEFSYRILGLTSEWSPWINNSTLEYPLLPPGEYTIEAKARNIFGVESEISNLEIIIKPPFWRTAVFYILVFILVITFFILIVKFREQNLQKAKRVLEQKVKERTAEIERQKDEISEQKKEITDSIYYARRIQSAVLPSTAKLNEVLSEHFVLFLPKDIVSGDFYWSTVKGDKIVILAADCTGHGVPGAFMSMLGVSFLNEIVSSHKLDDAGSILNMLRDHVKSTLAQSENSVQTRDGMDIALCIIDQKQMKLQFAGAYNPLYMIRKGEMTEIKGDKMPIGWYDVDTSFTNHVVDFKKDDCFYICSDGYTDQFGGELGKKFLAKPFKELLLRIHSNTMDQQKELLHDTFGKWKGNLSQIDDVLVIGFRI